MDVENDKLLFSSFQNVVTVMIVFQALTIFLVLRVIYSNFHVMLCSSCPIYIFCIVLVCSRALVVRLLMKCDYTFEGRKGNFH